MKTCDIRSDNTKRFVIFLTIGIALLFSAGALTLFFGANTLPPETVFDAIFNFNENDFDHVIVRNMRLPRLIADLIVGVCLSVAGAIMQGTTKNPMADSGIMGISSGATLGVVIVLAFIPEAGRFEKMGVSALGAGLVTLLIYTIAFIGKGRITSERMVLSGMAISTLLSSITTAVILKYGLMNQMIRYTSGSSANTIWKDVWVALPFFSFGLIVSLIISRSLTVMNLGEEVSKSLGANVAVTRTLSTVVVLILSAVAVIIIGPVGYIGLMIPYIARYMVGTDYRLVLPVCAIYGGAFVVIVDFVARLIHPGMEYPIGILITIIGVPFFIYVSRRQEGDKFYD